MTTWEYATAPLLIHATQAILNNWGQDGWELVQVVPGPNPDSLVACFKAAGGMSGGGRDHAQIVAALAAQRARVEASQCPGGRLCAGGADARQHLHGGSTARHRRGGGGRAGGHFRDRHRCCGAGGLPSRARRHRGRPLGHRQHGLLRPVKVTVYVAAAPGFTDIPAVADGASKALGIAFGVPHARSAVGVAELPRGAAVEVDVVFAVAGLG